MSGRLQIPRTRGALRYVRVPAKVKVIGTYDTLLLKRQSVQLCFRNYHVLVMQDFLCRKKNRILTCFSLTSSSQRALWTDCLLNKTGCSVARWVSPSRCDCYCLNVKGNIVAIKTLFARRQAWKRKLGSDALHGWMTLFDAIVTRNSLTFYLMLMSIL